MVSTLEPQAKIEMARKRRLLPQGMGATLPALILVLVFFVLPVVALLTRSFTEPVTGLQNYVELLGSSTYLKIFFNTFFVSAVTSPYKPPITPAMPRMRAPSTSAGSATIALGGSRRNVTTRFAPAGTRNALYGSVATSTRSASVERTIV